MQCIIIYKLTCLGTGLRLVWEQNCSLSLESHNSALYSVWAFTMTNRLVCWPMQSPRIHVVRHQGVREHIFTQKRNVLYLHCTCIIVKQSLP